MWGFRAGNGKAIIACEKQVRLKWLCTDKIAMLHQMVNPRKGNELMWSEISQRYTPSETSFQLLEEAKDLQGH